MPYVIGITGNIACGKTSVGQMLVQLGAERYIDADLLVHRLYERDQPIAIRVAECFGPQVVAIDGSIDRKALGAIVFHDPEAMKQLESIVHPEVHQAIQKELEKVSPHGIAVLDAVKLLEGGSSSFCHAKWLILCPEEQQMQRLMQRNAISLEEAQARIKAQPDITAKLAMVDEIIQNRGTSEATYQQVAAAFKRFCSQFSIA
ncbi:dephospho-CoA kinase [Dictyobacter formicarum]|uniref:Dephospho-CoA kinase n=1 Tax=Dictyobacter formicarum TaxID=2778368 RepID=A0ABQ3VA91_9CHLR|nr:dephospho-CoA kinase [Dictyobacter formicarum]GHO82855.1 dephospho-CoA kinase [Dictyobacter formicarum]